VFSLKSQAHLKDFLPGWVFVDGEFGDVAFSSRIRLARNLKGIPFPGCAKEKQLATVNETVKQALKNKSDFGSLAFINIEDLTPGDRPVLVEKHLCSPQFIEKPHFKSLIINQEQSISIMVNEEDHLRIQTIMPGFSLEDALHLANQVDDFLEDSLEYCFDECCGYLTACPTNVGTGIRASVMLHLPGLTLVDQVKKVLYALTHIGINVRGMYGEGTESYGDLYQVSNQVTLGRSEEDLTNHLKNVCRQVIEQEKTVREALLKDSKVQLEDKLFRSYGILTQARILTSQETLKLLSDVKLGVELGIISGVNKVNIRKLIFLTRASILQKMAGKELTPSERDFYRAKTIRDFLNLDSASTL
jgi:protein arginine kinase